jgi:hypothetical protein
MYSGLANSKSWTAWRSATPASNSALASSGAASSASSGVGVGRWRWSRRRQRVLAADELDLGRRERRDRDNGRRPDPPRGGHLHLVVGLHLHDLDPAVRVHLRRSRHGVRVAVGQRQEPEFAAVHQLAGHPDLEVHVVQVHRDARGEPLADLPRRLHPGRRAEIEVALAEDLSGVRPGQRVDPADHHRAVVRSHVTGHVAQRQWQILPAQRVGLDQPPVAGQLALHADHAGPALGGGGSGVDGRRSVFPPPLPVTGSE